MRTTTVRFLALAAAVCLAAVPVVLGQAAGDDGRTAAAAPADRTVAPAASGTVGEPVPAPPSSGNAPAAPDVSNGGGNSGLVAVMGVTLIIWLGLFLYVFALDRKVRRLEGP